MKTLAVIALSSGWFSSCGDCPGVCSPKVFVRLVDNEDKAIQPTTGTVTINGIPTAFSCRRAGEVLDGELLHREVACSGSTLEFNQGSFESLRVVINDELGRTFDGEIPLRFVESGSVICGSKCRHAKATVTVK